MTTANSHEGPSGPPIQIELHVPDFDAAREFYGAFGFTEVVGASSDDEYMVMALGNQALCFWPGNETWKSQSYFKRFASDTKRGFGVEIVVRVNDLDAAHDIAKQRDCIVCPVRTRPWGMRDFRIEDPFGFYVRFTDGEYMIPSS